MFYTVSPIITLKTTTASTLDEGATRTLLCVASGNPEPTYMWYKDNIKIQEDRNNSHYTITSASRNDAGTYRCEAVVNVPTLGQYSDSYTVQVTVRCKSTHNTYFYSFPWIAHLMHFVYYYNTMLNRWVMRLRKLPAYKVSWTNS